MKIFSSFLKSLSVVLFAAILSLAGELEMPAPDSLSAVPENVSFNEEIAVRDSIMAVRDSACTAEKDSLRSAMTMENAMCESWKQSYETMKTNNETCAQALSVSIGVNEKKNEEVKEVRSSAGTMVTSSFIGGIGIGMLLFWLIFE